MSRIEDVARLAGVSTATVSRALRGLPKVSEHTRARVLAAAAELDYVASPTAASLASGKTRVVGVVVPYVTRWYFAQLISGASRVLRDHGYHVLLLDVGDNGPQRTLHDPSLCPSDSPISCSAAFWAGWRCSPDPKQP